MTFFSEGKIYVPEKSNLSQRFYTPKVLRTHNLEY